MNTLRLLLLYCWVKLQFFTPRKVKRKASLSREERQAAELITAKLKETPKFSAMSEAEKTAFIIFGIIIGVGLLKSLSKTTGSTGRKELPRITQRIFVRLLKDEDLECLIGDLLEEYQEKVERVSVERAKLWLYWQICHSILPLALEAARAKLYSWLHQGVR